MEESKIYKLGEVCTKIGSGATPKGGKEAYLGGDTSLIRSQNVLDFSFSWDGLAYINDEQASKLNGVELEQNDVLLNITGDSVARACIVPDEALPARVNQHVAIIRGDQSIVLNDYILYYLQFKKQYLLSLSQGGATRNALTKGMIEELEIPLPTLNKQKEIVSILKSLDDKIGVNRKINENLEQQAQALFKSWFVDFEPFKDGEFEESELGMIPKGWRVGAIGDYCKDRSGYAFKSSWWSNSGIPVVKIKNITDDGRLDMTDSSFVSNEHADLAKEFQTKVGDLLIAMTGATIGKFCIVHSNNKLCVNQRVGKFFLGENPLKKLPFVYYNLRRPNVFEEIVRRGQGSAQPNISGKDIETISIIYPSEEIISQFNILLYSLFEKIICNLQESRRLATLRDTLLPKLMSGELKVNDMRLSEKQ